MKRITNFELGTLSYFLMKSFVVSILFNNIIEVAKQDSYISIVIGIFIGIIPLIAFFMLFNFEPNKNIFDKNKVLFGKYIGNLINILLISFTLFLSLILFINLITFIYDNYLNNTPLLLISVSLIIVILYTLSKGLHALLRGSSIFFMISIILFLISIIGLLFKIDLNNFKPPFMHNYFKGSFIYIAYFILPMYLLLLIPKSQLVHPKQTNKTLFIYYLFTSFIILLIIITIIGFFGIKLIKLYDYPEYEILKYVYISGVSSRINSILFIQNILDILIFIIYGILFCSKGISHLIEKKESIISPILSILILLASQKLYQIPLIRIISHLYVVIFIFGASLLLISSILLLLKHKVGKNT